MKVDSERKLGFGLTVALFIASGFSSLIYQVVWTRMLVLVFGSTTFATSTVLAVFMGGLASGSFLAGRVADRIDRPFLWYGILEGVIGLWALIVPVLFTAAVPLYRLVWQYFHPTILPFSLLRCLMALLILIVPTACMGATLPLLARFVTASLELVGRRVGTLYSVNTIGAVAGAALAGFVLLPALGLSATTLIAALVNFLLCAAVISLVPWLEQRRTAQSESSQPEPESGPTETAHLSLIQSRQPLSWSTRLVIISFGVSGAAAMIYEVGWTRTLLMVIGSSTYAFTVMLSTFLTGIFLGSLICARFVDRAREPVAWFSALEFAVCLFGLLSLVEFNYLPWWNLLINQFSPRDSIMTIAGRFLLSASILLPLTLCLGAIFPAVIKACTRELESVGRSVGTLYSVNTLGAILGAFAAGFALVPYLGVERTLIVASIVNLAVGIILLLLVNSVSLYTKVAAVALSVPIFVWCWQAHDLWDRIIILTAQSERRLMMHKRMPYRSFNQWKTRDYERGDVLFWSDGASSTVGVIQWKDSGYRSLITNGHVDASNGFDRSTQALIAHYPLLWKPDAKQIAVIGWGSGQSAGTAAQFPVSSIVVIEMERAVVAASTLFHNINHRPENDRRVQLEVNDGRNYLLATDRKFDVIISEPSNPWQAGVCNLFTREYFQLCRDRLRPGGVLSCWTQTGEVPPESEREILASLSSVFPYVLVIELNAGNLALLASDQPLIMDFSRLSALFANKLIADDLQAVKLPSPEAVLSRIVAAQDGITKIVAGRSPNIDDTNRLEYTVGKSYENRSFEKENRQMLEPALGTPWKLVSFGKMTAEQKATVMAEVARLALLDGRTANGLSWIEESLAVARTVPGLRVAGMVLAQRDRHREALKNWAEALALAPKDMDTLQLHGMANLEGGHVDLARSDFRKVLEIDPDNRLAKYHLALTYAPGLDTQFRILNQPVFFTSQIKDRSADLVVKYLAPLAEDQDFVRRFHNVLFLLGEAEYQLGRFKQAEALLRKFLTLDKNSVSGQRILGSVLQAEGQSEAAAALWFSSYTLAQDAEAKLRVRAIDLLKAGRQDEAIHVMTQCLELWPGDSELYSNLEPLAAKNAEAGRAVSVFKSINR